MFRQTPRNEKRTRFARLLYFGQRLVVTIINMFTHYLHSLDVKDFIPYKIFELYLNAYLPPVQNATLQPSWPSDIGAVQTWFSITRINGPVDPKFRVTDFPGISKTEKLTKPRDNSFWNLQSHKLRSSQKKIPVNEQRRFSWPAPCPGIKAQKKRSTFAQTQEASQD